EDLFVERQRHPCCHQEGCLPGICRGPSTGHPVPAGNQGAAGAGAARPTGLPRILALG
ncbi:MAG: Exodeoxyribonuclease III, partial [uncultured Thermomicrobiales bacterium]